jgi:hypothetical protein
MSSTKLFLWNRKFNFTEMTKAALTYLRKSKELIVDRPYRLLDGLFESSADAHDFTDALHATAKKPADPIELLEVPTGYLDDNVVQARLKASASYFRYGVLDLVQWNAQTELSGNERKGITRGF